MANFIPPLQMGQVRVIFSCQQVLKIAVFEAKMILQKQLWQPKLKNFFEWFLDLVRLRHAFSSIAACVLLRRVFYPQCIVNFSNFTINTSRRSSRRGRN